jgi:hypothetical protein
LDCPVTGQRRHFHIVTIQQSRSLQRQTKHVHCVNSSRADSRVNCLKTSDVSETLNLHHQGSLSLRMETGYVSETSEVFKQLTRLSARDEFVQFCRRECLKTKHTFSAYITRDWEQSVCVWGGGGGGAGVPNDRLMGQIVYSIHDTTGTFRINRSGHL